MSEPFDRFPMDRGPYPDQVNTQFGWLITSYFGGRIDPITGRPGNHGGQDLAYSGCRNQPFYAVKAGRVSQGWDPGGGGNWTSLFCDDGDYIGYGHALRFAPSVNGTHVEAGTILGYVDSTGGSTGDHMHFAYRPAGASGYRDPFDMLAAATNAGAPPEPQRPDPPQPEPLPTSKEDDHMPRPTYELDEPGFAGNGETWCETQTGLEQAISPTLLAKQRQGSEGHPAIETAVYQAPRKLLLGEMQVLIAQYHGQVFADAWRQQKGA